jgi:hypothetical protein
MGGMGGNATPRAMELLSAASMLLKDVNVKAEIEVYFHRSSETPNLFKIETACIS